MISRAQISWQFRGVLAYFWDHFARGQGLAVAALLRSELGCARACPLEAGGAARVDVSALVGHFLRKLVVAAPPLFRIVQRAGYMIITASASESGASLVPETLRATSSRSEGVRVVLGVSQLVDRMLLVA